MGFEYLDYPKLVEEVDVGIKKRTISILEQDAIRTVEAEKSKKKPKIAKNPKVAMSDNEGSSHLDTWTLPSLKRKRTGATTTSRVVERPAKVAKGEQGKRKWGALRLHCLVPLRY